MKERILFAEDDGELRELVTGQLLEEGYMVAAVDNGDEAIALAGSRPFDLALLDIRMPGIDGLEVLTVLRARTPLMRVVMLTGVDELSVALEAMKRGANDYVTKPFSLKELLSCIERALER